MAAEVSKPDFSYQWASGGSIVAPSNVKIQTGWTAEVPPFQWENFLQHRQDNAILHLFQKGISEWDSASNYYFTTNGTRSFVQGSDGNIYVAVQDSVGQDPTTDATDTYWKVAFIDAVALNTALASSGPIVGSSRNASMKVATAGATATFTADEVIVGVSLTGTRYKLSSFSKLINLAITGVGGMDTGAAPANGYVALYAIYNPTTLTSALLAVNATSSVVTEVYSGVNMPAGYTASALVSVWPTASSQFISGSMYGRVVSTPLRTALSTSVQQASATLLSVAGYVPPNAKNVSGNLSLGSSSSGASLAAQIAGSSGGIGAQQLTGSTAVANASASCAFNSVPMVTSQTVYYTDIANIGTAAFTITIGGYDF